MPEQKKIVKNAVASEVASTETALERKSRRFSLIWVVPLLALCLTGWVIWNNTLNVGPEIKINISTADGIEKGKTLIKTRAVTVGTVTNVELSKDYSSTVLTVQMDRGTESLLRPDTRFWIVKPRIEKAGISGLDTLLSGSYIQLNIGSKAGFQTEFTALKSPPVLMNDEKGLMLSLISNGSRKLSEGDTVFFRGFEVGVITESKLDMDSQAINYKAFIREPYDTLVTNNTRFWISSGIDFKITPAGAEVHTEALDSLISGGISFDNFVENVALPSTNLTEEAVKTGCFKSIVEESAFRLYDRREDARVAALEGGLLYVVMLDHELGNLTPGSPVMFKGVKVGEVVKAPWFDDNSEVFTAHTLPVLIALDGGVSANQNEIKRTLDRYLKKSQLCASISSANLIFSNNQLSLVHDPKVKCTTKKEMYQLAKLEENAKTGLLSYRKYSVIPLVPSESLTAQFNVFMDKLNDFDIAGLSSELQNSLRAFTDAMNAFTNSNKSVQKTQVIRKVAESFENFNESIKGYGPDTEIYKNINQNLRNIEQILQDLAPLVSEVGQDPSSIIFGSPDDPQPRAPR